MTPVSLSHQRRWAAQTCCALDTLAVWVEYGNHKRQHAHLNYLMLANTFAGKAKMLKIKY